MARIVVPLVALVAVSGPAERANASCFLPSAVDLLEALDGRDDVPPNLVLIAQRIPETPVLEETLTAVPIDGGAPVAFLLGGDVAAFRPTRELDANVDYVLCLDPRDFPCARFRTAAGRDEVAPDAPVAAVKHVGGLFALDTECGGAVNGTGVTFSVDVPDDAAALMLTRTLGSATTLVSVSLAGRSPLTPSDFTSEGGDATYELTVFDLAGNASEPTVIEQSLGCPGSCGQADGASMVALTALLALARLPRGAGCPRGARGAGCPRGARRAGCPREAQGR